MAARREVDSQLLARAHRGEPKRCTAETPAERAAVHRAEYERRLVHHGDLSARQALGHDAPGDVLPVVTFFAQLGAGASVLEDVTVSRRGARSVARYLGLVVLLGEGRISPAAFERQVASWRPITILEAWRST
jgi:hypothetical protein